MWIEEQLMARRYSINPDIVREPIEMRLGRALSESEFERILCAGDGLFWDYLPKRGFLQCYDQATLYSTARTLQQLQRSKTH